MNDELFERAQKVIPGGVNSPVRAFRSVGGVPKFINKGQGPYIFDSEGKRYLDFICSWGPLVFGHANRNVLDAIKEALGDGTSFGAPTEKEVIFAELLCDIVPGVDKIRMVNSGTEATMSAARLARGYTSRNYIMKFNGCYHGHADLFLVEAGSGVATFGIAGSSGVPQSTAEYTVSVQYNNLDLVEQTIKKIGADKFAAMIIEPVAGNMGLVLPKEGFLKGLREICDRHGIVLIFDEVMSGFRVALGGASERFNITPDLVTLGKVIGGGLPVGAFGGKEEIMSCLAPNGSVYQAGTLSGNPIAMSAGLATIRALQKEDPYKAFEEASTKLMQGFKQAADKASIPMSVAHCGSMFGFFFSKTAVHSFEDASKSDKELFKKFFHGMLNKGVYLAPSSFEAGFLSTKHEGEQIDYAISAAEEVFSAL